MEEQRVLALIVEAIRGANALRTASEQIDETEDGLLFGGDGPLDSIALVSLLMDIEDALLEQGLELSLSSEHAMSLAHSPYRSVRSLADYVLELMP
ncbi:MAG: hypothetical protein V2J02_10940 [Pseudomonadales bacterium]|jgi:acyl carrier protein|nr:hypothetical protein [Pseudomonadales bacterium]